MKKLILDVCCGGRMFWYDKNNPYTIFGDNRELHDVLCDGRTLDIKPDVVLDFTNLPYPAASFKLVVFDPPHLTNVGKNSWLAKKYGKLEGSWKEELKKGFSECFRVLENYGILIFKWNEQQVKLKEILELAEQRPLFGHHSGKLQKTHWICFMKIEEVKDDK